MLGLIFKIVSEPIIETRNILHCTHLLTLLGVVLHAFATDLTRLISQPFPNRIHLLNHSRLPPFPPVRYVCTLARSRAPSTAPAPRRVSLQLLRPPVSSSRLDPSRTCTMAEGKCQNMVYVSDDSDDSQHESDESDEGIADMKVDAPCVAKGRRNTVVAAAVSVAGDWTPPNFAKSDEELATLKEFLRSTLLFRE